MTVRRWLFGLAFAGSILHIPLAVRPMSDELVIEDCSRTDGRSNLGTAWQFFTDRVMGGVSSGVAERDSLDGLACIRLQGRVSLENNGGFIQVALPLGQEREAFDASAYEGVRLTMRGNGEDYFVHLRTSDTRLPWQYYRARFAAEPAWRQIDLPFTVFRAENLDAPLDSTRLLRLAIVAAKKEIDADIAVARITLYR